MGRHARRFAGSRGCGLKNKDQLPRHLQEWLKDPDKVRREHRAALKTELIEVGALLAACVFIIPALLWFMIACLTND